MDNDSTMHELSIAMNLIDIAREESRARNNAVVHAVHVKVGQLSGVVSEALSSAFEIAREETTLANTRLVIEDAPVMVDCPTCGSEQQADSIQNLCCSVCGTISSNITQGRELEVVALELEIEDQPQ